MHISFLFLYLFGVSNALLFQKPPFLIKTMAGSEGSTQFKTLLIGGLMSFSLFNGYPALAESLDDVSSDTPIVKISVNTDTSEDNNRVNRKLEKLKRAEDDLSYGAKLQKEQKKQEIRKKSKSERSKDLCESLGRGC